MIRGLSQLGIPVSKSGDRLEVTGCDGRIPGEQADLFIGNSGTTLRFLTAMLTLGHGHFRLDGTPRMRERPIGDLIDALGQLGADVATELPTGCPPLIIRAAGLPGGTATIRGNISSQYLSGLLLAAPYAKRAVTLLVDGLLVSQPYVHMTLGVMRAFGVEVSSSNLARLQVPNTSHYRACAYNIEPDASAASYFFAAAAITGGKIIVQGLARDALQGDIAFVDLLAQMGCRITHHADSLQVEGAPLHGIDVDMNAISDTVQTLGAVALFAEGPTTIRGVAHIRHKETDRIGALACELRKLGAVVDEFDDGLRITPKALQPAEIATYDDHRMAMSLALPGLRIPGVVILDPGCTSKTYPGYFQDLASIATQA
jgi:3-phosphoshikimate 1-carboxyvinyltransferase